MGRRRVPLTLSNGRNAYRLSIEAAFALRSRISLRCRASSLCNFSARFRSRFSPISSFPPSAASASPAFRIRSNSVRISASRNSAFLISRRASFNARRSSRYREASSSIIRFQSTSAGGTSSISGNRSGVSSTTAVGNSGAGTGNESATLSCRASRMASARTSARICRVTTSSRKISAPIAQTRTARKGNSDTGFPARRVVIVSCPSPNDASQAAFVPARADNRLAAAVRLINDCSNASAVRTASRLAARRSSSPTNCSSRSITFSSNSLWC